MTKEYEKCINLLALVMQFYPTQLDEQINRLFDEVQAFKKDKVEKVSDKIKRMKKFDIQTMNEILSYASPKICNPIKDSAEAYKDIK